MSGTGRVPRRVGNKTTQKTSLTILVLGDEGVGKSSLISAYVSRHFDEGVPGIMTRVRLPPEPGSQCITTIVDSQGGDAALISAVTARSLGKSGSENSVSSLLQKSAPSAKSELLQQQQQQSTTGSVSSGSAGGSGALGDATSSSDVAGGAAAANDGIAAAIEHVDVIVLVYDLEREETFIRLENHWLPLIEKCYNGELPVIVAGNKMDILEPPSVAGKTDEQAMARSRQQINSLLQRFKFVMQWIKCSAKNLLHIDEVFRKARHAVLYPIGPLYNLETAQLQPNFRRALTRIFRMYDRDHDGLLSNVELDLFQRAAFPVGLDERAFAGWKKVVIKNNTTNEAVVREGKFTVWGFLCIFEVFITQNRLDSPWRVMRHFGYDDKLHLIIPKDVTMLPSESSSKNRRQSRQWKLSSSAKRFLATTFYQFDTDKDGILSPNDIREIFSIVPEPSLPPWHPVRASRLFDGCFSLPKSKYLSAMPSSLQQTSSAAAGVAVAGVDNDPLSNSLSASGITIVSGASLPSVDVSPSSSTSSSIIGMGNSSSSADQISSRPLSYLDWMGHWHMISSISPSIARAELYRLGHVEGKKRRRSSQPTSSLPSAVTTTTGSGGGSSGSGGMPTAVSYGTETSREIRVLVLGSRGCGKTSLLDVLCSENGSAIAVTHTQHPETQCTHVKVKQSITTDKKYGGSSSTPPSQLREITVHLLLTEVPVTVSGGGAAVMTTGTDEQEQQQEKELSELLIPPPGTKKKFDMVMFTFDCSDISSFSYVKQLERAILNDDIPRAFIGTKRDTVEENKKDEIEKESKKKSETQEETDEKNTSDSENKTTTEKTNETGDESNNNNSNNEAVAAAALHCSNLDLEAPLLTSATSIMMETNSYTATEGRMRILDHLARCVLDDVEGIPAIKSKPHAEKKRKEAARRRKMIWIGGLVSVSVAAVAVGVGVFWGGVSKTAGSAGGAGGTAGGRKDRIGNWIRHFLGIGASAAASTAASAAAAGRGSTDNAVV